MKTKFHGIETVRFAFHMAALEHNVGYVSASLSGELLGSLPVARSLETHESKRLKSFAKVSVARTKRRKTETEASTSGYSPGGF